MCVVWSYWLCRLSRVGWLSICVCGRCVFEVVSVVSVVCVMGKGVW